MEHISVLLNETIEYLNIKADGTYVDMTLGGGGHALEVLKKLTTGKLIGIDQDEFAIDFATERLKQFDNKIIVRNNFSEIKNILLDLNINKVDGIYMDLGVSSFQFDDTDRGFSYNTDSKLDMRMNRENKLSAYEIVNNFEENEIYRIIRDYGEDMFAKNIAKHIVNYRIVNKIETTLQLAEIIKNAIPAKVRANEKHPAKRTFQALRIYVNDELNVLEKTIDEAVDLLNENGRLCIITFHSLEDKIVKHKFLDLEKPCKCPPNLPCVCGKKSKGKIVVRKGITPSDEEIINNKRSRSARLRVFERISYE